MPVVFLDDTYKPGSTKICFGLCDDGEQQPAYLDEATPLMWIAVVQNSGQKTVTFYDDMPRIKTFRKETGYVLQIKSAIDIE
jgi:hypothetical protein